MRNNRHYCVHGIGPVALVGFLLLPIGSRFAEAAVVLHLNPYEGVLWDQFGQHKANLHTHTTQSDGHFPPHEVIDLYHSHGYTVLALTDHNRATYPWQDFGRDPDPLGMVAIAGNELSRHQHTLSLFSDFTTPTSDWNTALEGVGAAGGLAVVCHPAMHWKTWWPPAGDNVRDEAVEYYAERFRAYPHLVGVEFSNATRPLAEYPLDRQLWDKLLMEFMPERPIWGFAVDDMHSMAHFGRDWIAVLTPQLSEAAVRDAITHGAFFSSTIRLHPAGDQSVEATPVIQRVDHDTRYGVITLTATQGGAPLPDSAYQWIADGVTVHTGPSLDYVNTPGINAYVRAEITGDGGTTYTNPFGFMPAGASVVNGLVGYWNFEDDVTGNLVAGRPNATVRAGNPISGVREGESGLAGDAMVLNGSSSIRLPFGTAALGDSFTISAWYWQAPDPANRNFIFEASNNFDVSYGTSGNNNTFFSHVGQQGAGNVQTEYGEWHHVLHSFESTWNETLDRFDTTLSVYVNGILRGTPTTVDTALMDFLGINLGDARDGQTRRLHGMIDDVALWNRALSGVEAQFIYSTGYAGNALITTHVKSDNTHNLNLGSSWESGVAPGELDYLVFNATFAQSGTLDTGGALPVLGLRVSDGTGLIHINNTSNNYLQVGALGVDMLSAQRNLTVAHLRLGADQAWDVGSGRTFTVGSLSGDHALTKAGPGTVVLTGAGTSAGGTVLAEGTLQVGHNAALGTGSLTLSGGTLSSNSTSARTLANDVTIGGNVTLGHSTNRGTLTFTGDMDLGGATRQITTNANVTLAGVIDNGGLIKAGGGTYSTLTLTGANTFAGGTTLTAGTLRVGDDSALGTGAVTLNAGTLSAVGTTVRTLANEVTLGGNVSLGTAADSGALIFTGPVNLGGATRQITTASDVTFSGVVSNGGLTKAGAGTLSLSGANTYSGGTTISRGTVAALSDGALGTGNVTLAGGALHVESSIPLANDVVLDAAAGRNFIRGTLAVNYLVVGGGGGGAGRDSSGGGGGGGVLSNLVTPGMDLVQVVGSGVLDVTIGDGGAGGANAGGSNGQPSMLGSILALGGGGGAAYNGAAGDGASGGGGGRESVVVGGTGTPGQGFDGGSGSNGTNSSVDSGGGGGGAGARGGDAVKNVGGGDGGIGLAVDITGADVYYGGGGGGTPHRNSSLSSGAGGLGGGGDGAATTTTTGNPGLSNTGGGGGASRNATSAGALWTGGKGGSGIVIVRYLGDPAATGGTISAGSGSAAGYTLHTFTAIGVDTLTFGPINATISGTLSGAGGFTWDTPGTLTLTSANTHSGDTRVTAGTVALGNAQALQNSTLTLAGGTAAFTAPGASSYTLGGLAGTSALDAGANTLVVGGNNQSTAYSGNLTAAGLTKTGSGMLTLAGSNTLGGTTVSGGALAALSEGAVGAGAVTLDGGALHVERNVEFSNQIVLAGSAEENVIRGAVAVDYLIVGGGGGGAGRDVAGGGGGGGVLSNLVTPDMAPIGLATGTYDVTVGDGGAGGVNHTVSPDSGEASSFDSIVALGGGAGGPYNSPAGSGASGGGSGRESTPGTGIDGQGFDGGIGGGGSGSGGGGGGAGAPGSDGGTSGPAGSGGNGLAIDITGAEVYYGGGGGGTWHRNDSVTTRPSGLGGLGGGGDGADSHEPSNPGESNSGGGGGAARSDVSPYYVGGKGGSGIVVVRYLGDPAATGGSITAGTGSAAGYTLHTFTDVGAHSLQFGAIDATISSSMTGGGGFTWDTPGTLTLTGSSDYTGATRITAGTLALAGTGSIAGSTTIDVHAGATFDLTGTTGTYGLQSGQTLKGEGLVRGGLVMNSGSWLAPGASPGILSYEGDLTLNGSGLLVDIFSDAGPGEGHDLVEFHSGTLTLTGDAQITVDLGGVNPALGSSYTIISGFENEVTDGFDPNVLVQNAGDPLSFEFFRVDYGPGSIALTLIPEPGTLVLLAMALLGLLGFRQRGAQ